MSEPARLHTEPESELERSLLDAGRSYKVSAASRSKALAALGIVGVTASSTSAASAVTKAGLGKWLAASALVAGAALPALHYLRQNPTKPALDPSAVGATAANAPVAAAVAPAPSAALAASSAVEPTRSSVPGPVHTESKPAALAAELGALDAARSALASGDTSGALARLDAYARNFPRGKLSLEAEVLRIDALAKSGQTAAAQKRAQAFIQRHPDSVLAARVRAYAGQ
ncbi:MAG TPA: hypothetical protein VNW92_09900 [Polyangiaceae bacterium]|jgi:hypothetical protein|nr:hypothetical protein [Polyangiaceae bacterium]